MKEKFHLCPFYFSLLQQTNLQQLYNFLQEDSGYNIIKKEKRDKTIN